MVTSQEPVPVPAHAPPQPVKVEEAAGVAVSVTSRPLGKVAAQVVPQSIPAGNEVTLPVPIPLLVTLKERAIRVKVAVTDVAASMLTVQVPVPGQEATDQPAKVELTSGAAVNVTTVPAS